MRLHLKTSLLAAACGALLGAATPSQAAIMFNVDDLREGAATSMVQQVSHGAPAGAKCIKWTRRWNHRHGFGHRRCVQWR